MNNDSSKTGFRERRVFDLPAEAVRGRIAAALRGAFDEEVVEVAPEHWRVVTRRKGAASIVDVTLEETEPRGGSAVTVAVEVARGPAMRALLAALAALAVLSWVAVAIIASNAQWNLQFYGPGPVAIVTALTLAALGTFPASRRRVRAVDEAEAADRLWAELERVEALPRVGSYRGGLRFADPETELAEEEAALAEAESAADETRA